MAIDSPREVDAENAPDRVSGYVQPRFGPPTSEPWRDPRPPFPACSSRYSYGYDERAVARLILADPRLSEQQIADDFQRILAESREAERQRDLVRATSLGLTEQDLAADPGRLYRAGIGRAGAVRAFERERSIAGFTHEHGREPAPDELRELDNRRGAAELNDVLEQTELAEADFYAARAGHGHDLMSLSSATTQALGPMFREQGNERSVAGREQVWLQAQAESAQQQRQEQVMKVAGVPTIAPGQARQAGSQAGAGLGPAAHHRTPGTVAPREQLQQD